MGPLERMLKSREGAGFMQKQLETMHRNAYVLMQLINQLLDFRKAEAGKMQLQASRSNIVSFTEDVKLAFDELASSRNIEYTLSGSSEDIPLWYDKVMLIKVLFNLLSNAFKFTPDDSRITIKIDKKGISRNKSRLRIRVRVRDNGKGIPKENIDLIFDRFFQFGERFGTGIGLPLAKSLVELHQGSIKVKSTEKKGTCFAVYLPLGEAHLSEEQRLQNDRSVYENDLYDFDSPSYLVEESMEHAMENQEDTTYKETWPSILVVEDNSEVRNFIKGIFQNSYNLFEAADGEIGIEMARTNSIDLIISDVMMPVMDGMELCHEIKSNIRTSHIPVDPYQHPLVGGKGGMDIRDDPKSGLRIGPTSEKADPDAHRCRLYRRRNERSFGGFGTCL